MRRGLVLSVLILTAASMLGCGTNTSYTQLNPSPVPMSSRDPATVEVFSASKPERPYVEVGILEAQQESEFSTDDMPQIVAEMRVRAAEQGCDAVIINSNNDAVVGSTSDGWGSTDTLKGFRGACIMYKAAAAPAPAPAAAPAPEPATEPAPAPAPTPAPAAAPAEPVTGAQ